MVFLKAIVEFVLIYLRITLCPNGMNKIFHANQSFCNRSLDSFEVFTQSKISKELSH